MKRIIFSEIADFSYGIIPDKHLISENGEYPIWSGYLYSGFYPLKNTNIDDLIVVARGVGGTGDVKIATFDCWLTNLSIRVKLLTKDILPKYLFYKFSKNNLRYLDSGSAQSQITINDLKRLQFDVHPIDIQHHIVNTTSSLLLKSL